MGAPAVDVKDILVAAGVGTFAATSGWSIRIGWEEDQPDTMITIYDTPGNDPNPKWSLDEPEFQVRVRGSPFDYTGAYGKALGIKDVLLGLQPQTVNSTFWSGIWQVSDIFLLARDDRNRYIFVTNWRAAREPAASGTRTAL